MPFIHVVLIIIKNEFFVVFVNRIVSQMNKSIFHVTFLSRCIIFSRKTRQPLLIKINSRRVMAINKNIKPEIKLQIFNQ